jgi:pimeloyl-ACP methyl ester carboxylesterase
VVVFEYGVGEKLETWKPVQDEVSRFTETLAYNRAGYEGSPPASGIRDAVSVVDELRALLSERGLRPPYVLVGHSLGGLYMQYFARAFPDDVAGLVLVDSTHWEHFERIRRAAPSLVTKASPEQSRRMPEMVRRETQGVELSGREVQESTPLRDMPLIVLSAGQQPETTLPPQLGSQVRRRRGLRQEFWLGLQRELAAQSPSSRHIIVQGSGHFIQIDKPQVVTEAIRDVVVAARGIRPRRQSD